MVELVGRWDDWDPDLHNESGPSTVDERELVGGVNFYIEGGATRLSANIVRSTFPSGLVQASNELVLELHVVW